MGCFHKDLSVVLKNMNMSAALLYFVNPKFSDFVLKLPTKLNLDVKWRTSAESLSVLITHFIVFEIYLEENSERRQKPNMVCSELGLWMGFIDLFTEM